MLLPYMIETVAKLNGRVVGGGSRGPRHYISYITYCLGTLYRRSQHTVARCLYDFMSIFLEAGAKPAQ